eukprot:CAMPEP_0181336108 /NCGR_PEP_ID=MMETSP1101-20121128/27228_1 /TAXON_ID=46948 /ORGANISM="Rhodomonas abbreviata, Strain Caron Lab Isolate" /LENGTH=41 /DNA_ID= /DNA_START= /DNA_END= /DNA_ORIENTATION=
MADDEVAGVPPEADEAQGEAGNTESNGAKEEVAKESGQEGE